MLLRAYEDAELALATKLETPAAGQDEIRYFQSAWALDDRGTLLTADFRPPWFTGPTDPLLFSAPHPLATELRWVEGELMTLPNRRNVRIEMRFPQPGSAAIHREGDDVLLGLSVDQQPIPSAPVPPLIKAPLPPEDTHPHLRIRFAFRNMALESVPMGVHSVPLPRGIGKSGASYVGSSSGTSFYHIRNWVEHVQDVTFPGAGEPLSRLVWEIPVRDSPHSLGVVRMERVRLPRPTTMPRVIEKAAGPGVVPPPADGNAAPPVPRTGTLIIPAPLVGLPTPGHGVAVGLSQRSAPGWGPVRWEDAPVDSSGRGVLRNVKPGRYRILIRSKPHGAAVEVVIQSGHETVLPTARTK
jgi:hypothetical protein